MNQGRTIFSQLMDVLPMAEFRRLVAQFRGNHRARKLSCLDQFYIMAFAQLSYRESLRDIEACLRAAPTKPFCLGIRAQVARSTLADANERRDWRIYAGLAQALLLRAERAYSGAAEFRHFHRVVYAFDSSIIELSLKLFPWSRYKKHAAGVKLHTQLNVSTHIPAFLRVTRANVHDVNLLDELRFEPGAVYVFDRGYVDFERLYRITQAGAFFVIRARKNTRFRRTQSHRVDEMPGVRSDQTVRLASFYPARGYPDSLRRVRYIAPETGKRLTFITNQFHWSPLTVAEMYKARWAVELFFKWIKQHLRIKAFYGTSENAVKTQLWIALSVYLILALIKKDLGLPHSLHSISQVLSLHLFEKVPLQDLLTKSTCTETAAPSSNQGLLFDF